jgi:hypothetical protein
MVDAATRTDDYVENLGFVVMAAGMTGLAWPGGSSTGEARMFRMGCWAFALALAARDRHQLHQQ